MMEKKNFHIIIINFANAFRSSIHIAFNINFQTILHLGEHENQNLCAIDSEKFIDSDLEIKLLARQFSMNRISVKHRIGLL
jgi:hypothetical protein